MNNRRNFLGALSSLALAAAAPRLANGRANSSFFNDRGQLLKVWVFSDAHVATDLGFRRESLAQAITQSEYGGEEGADPIDWDIALALGDFSGATGTPTDEEGREVDRQFGALKKHAREDIYSIAGNHDATPYTDKNTQWWFRKWLDPLGENPEYSQIHAAKRKYPPVGTWERYHFKIGNLLFLMMSDRNDLPPPVGRDPIDIGGYPAGAITDATFAWWKDSIESNPDSIVISAHHHMLKDTTTASGLWGGFDKNSDGSWRPKYHGFYPKGAPEGASFLYFVGDKADSGLVEGYLQSHTGKVDFWLGGHTHLYPIAMPGEKSYLERKWGTTFINCSPLSKYHVDRPPSSRLITFAEGSDEARVQFYLHSDDFYFQGFYPPLERVVRLSKRFRLRGPT